MVAIENPMLWIWAIRKNREGARRFATRWLVHGMPVDRRTFQAMLANADRQETELLEWCEP